MEKSAATFRRPYRTVGMRLINWTGRQFERLGVRTKLSPSSVMDRAKRLSGLSDFGDYSFEEPLSILIDSLETHARHSPIGRFLTRQTCVNFVTNRLVLEDWVKREPEIVQQEVRRPIFVIGLPRTGTTLLYNLLCQDPHCRPLMSWETLWPRPVVPEGQRDPRRARTRHLFRLINHIAPQLKQVHPLVADGPEECTWLLANTFASPSFTLNGKCTEYLSWVLSRSSDEAEQIYADYRRQLQVLQWGGSDAHWILKSPAHLPFIGVMLRQFPDAGVIQTHRDPRKMMGSACSLFAVSRGIYSDHVNPMELGPELAENLRSMLEKAIQSRQDDGGRVCDVHFRKLVSDPIGTVERIYEHFRLPMTNEMRTRMQTWVRENPQHKHGVHRYELEQFGLTPEIVDGIFAAYCERFGVNDHGNG